MNSTTTPPYNSPLEPSHLLPFIAWLIVMAFSVALWLIFTRILMYTCGLLLHLTAWMIDFGPKCWCSTKALLANLKKRVVSWKEGRKIDDDKEFIVFSKF